MTLSVDAVNRRQARVRYCERLIFPVSNANAAVTLGFFLDTYDPMTIVPDALIAQAEVFSAPGTTIGVELPCASTR
jgi:hypothetical protein